MAAYLRQRQLIQQIEAEYGEPLTDVLQGFADLGYSRAFVARLFNVSQDTMQRLAARCGITFKPFAQPPMSDEQKRRLSAIKLRSRRRDNRLITVDGTTQHLSGWARDLGVHPSTIIKRLDAGWTEREACRRPSRLAGRDA